MLTMFTGHGAPDTPGDIGRLGPRDLAVLKQQLRELMARVEGREQVLEAEMRPRTAEQLDDLAQRMREALQDLEAQRAELEKKPR